MEVKGLFKRIGVDPHVIELDHLGSSVFFFFFFYSYLLLSIGYCYWVNLVSLLAKAWMCPNLFLFLKGTRGAFRDILVLGKSPATWFSTNRVGPTKSQTHQLPN